MTTESSNLVDVGRITAVFGIQGWVKIHSGTEPAENLFEYHPWWLKTAHGVKTVDIDAVRPHGKGFVAHIKGVDDRDTAATYAGTTIAVERQQLPDLAEGEFYWHQLQGLAVISRFGGTQTRLGCVSRILETGANDVLVVQADQSSVDDRERLVPYIPGQYVLEVDLEARTLAVDWDPAF
ncbi:ribosome maturation factor RimM [Gilvimarinus agarilyticus]|uniref:ribosome maturation factor RimM n=1 Tax=unclassified Gilvimarinus TaxID=2642066 RepID=UPI001C093BE1|nr:MULTISPECIES: ribosome maturation factor RimM [unclassified Gilvimarinus]MBU2885993.1 ribosome maturation factor RimM [Gilvimarinus agarilyticus]MDO6570739.1 ribosome maturation factor RimM [Gilvimarinus sp. 2_MG-2023]MDO6747668.1 ribosome maturation factor RimM [Gilvimarinus sp. 1_MG-2023]